MATELGDTPISVTGHTAGEDEYCRSEECTDERCRGYQRGCEDTFNSIRWQVDEKLDRTHEELMKTLWAWITQ